MADQDGRHSEMITQLLRHVTSSPYDADVRRDIFRRTIYPPSLVVIVFIFSELRSGGGGGGGAGGGGWKRCSHNLQSDPLGSGFKKGQENFPL